MATQILYYSTVTYILAHIVNGHEHSAYNHDTDDLGINADWQSRFDDDYDSTAINLISYPGTHDTMADDGDGVGVDCQTSSLTKQLEAGIRVIDIRCAVSGNDLAIHHGVYYLSANLNDVLTECKNFLSSHSTEFILMRIKQESKNLANDDDLVSDQDFSDKFASYYDDSAYDGYFYEATSSSYIPKVSEVRGKIIVLQNFGGSRTFGISYSNGNIQDKYDIQSILDLYSKWEDVKSHLIATNSAYLSGSIPSNGFYMNYLSASGVGNWDEVAFIAYPYFVASGHSNTATGAPRLATGSTTCPTCDSDKYPDFPRVNCAGTWCTIANEGTNILTYDYIQNNDVSFVGILMIDFPGQGLIDMVINLNDCGSSYESSLTYPDMDCWTSGYVNDMDGPMDASQYSRYFAGLSSYHDSDKEDRRWKVRHCKPKGSNSNGLPSNVYLQYTDYDATWYQGCGGNSAISRAESTHDNYKEDRRWRFRCSPMPNGYRLTGCDWTDYINEFDGQISYNCADNGLIRTIYSYHNNHHEDRRFKLECCTVADDSDDYPTVTYTLDSDFANSYDGVMENRINSNKYLCGLYSEHDNNREDRIFKWGKCNVNGDDSFIASKWNLDVTAYDETWTKSCNIDCRNGGNAAIIGARAVHDNNKEDRAWTFKCGELSSDYKLNTCGWTGYLNTWDDPINFKCPGLGVVRSVWSQHDNNKEDRLFKFECCHIAHNTISISTSGSSEFGFVSCSTSDSANAETSDTVVITYFEGSEMFECQVEGQGGFGNNEYVCNSDDSTTRECISGQSKYGLQISISKNANAGEDDICIHHLLIDGNVIKANSQWVGDGDGTQAKNYLFYDLGTDASHIKVNAVGDYVAGVPICDGESSDSVISFGFKVCSGVTNGATTETVIMTYFQGDKMFQCEVDGTNTDGQQFICSSDDGITERCNKIFSVYALQISIPENVNAVDDVCVDNLIINGIFIDVDQEWVGDGDGSVDQHYRMYSFASNAADYFPSMASGDTDVVNGVFTCTPYSSGKVGFSRFDSMDNNRDVFWNKKVKKPGLSVMQQNLMFFIVGLLLMMFICFIGISFYKNKPQENKYKTVSMESTDTESTYYK